MPELRLLSRELGSLGELRELGCRNDSRVTGVQYLCHHQLGTRYTHSSGRRGARVGARRRRPEPGQLGAGTRWCAWRHTNTTRPGVSRRARLMTLLGAMEPQGQQATPPGSQTPLWCCSHEIASPPCLNGLCHLAGTTHLWRDTLHVIQHTASISLE